MTLKTKPKIILPNDWQPRPYQRDGFNWFVKYDKKRGIFVWHRRSGKDSTALNITACKAMQRPANYWHMLPEAEQARKVIWNGKDRAGRRFIDQAFPEIIRRRTLESSMQIDLINGSSWNLVGADNYNRLVGANVAGVVFSEYSLTNPSAWQYIKPILDENDGWALFIFTPRGRNHAFDLLEVAKKNPDFYTSVLSVDDTKAIPMSVIEDAIAEGMAPETVRQEYYCSFNAPNSGSYYGMHIEEAEIQGRITDVPVLQHLPVHTAWDIGIRDYMAIWFFQCDGPWFNIINYHRNNNQGMPAYIRYLKEFADQYRVHYGAHLGPFDLDHRKPTDGKTVAQYSRELGLDFTVCQRHGIDDGIHAVKMVLPQCRFDKTRCAVGLDDLTKYHSRFNEKLGQVSPNPVHDIHSHGADAFRIFAMNTHRVFAQTPDGRKNEERALKYDDDWIA